MGCGIVIAAGGDGTVTDVMQGLLATETALAVLPLGTGNDFSRAIGIGTSVDRAIAALVRGARRRIDVGRWQMDQREGHFLNVLGCGFDAVVAQRVNQGFRRLRGRTAYLAGILQTLLSYKATTLTIRLEDETVETRAMLCACANATSYGGGMLIAPTADLSDGLLDLVLVGELGKIEFLWNFPRVLKGVHLTHPKVIHRRLRKVEIVSHPPAPFLADGELLPPGRLTIEVLPSAIDVIVGDDI